MPGLVGRSVEEDGPRDQGKTLCQAYVCQFSKAVFKLKKLVYMAASQYTIQGWERSMELMKENKEEAYNWLMDVDKEEGARCRPG